MGWTNTAARLSLRVCRLCALGSDDGVRLQQLVAPLQSIVPLQLRQMSSQAPTPDAASLESKWKHLAELEMKNKEVDILAWKTEEGFECKPLYTSEDLGEDFQEEIPGSYPYTRGVYATMYTQKPWTIRQYSGFSTAKESNAFYKRNLKSGQKGLSVAFDLGM